MLCGRSAHTAWLGLWFFVVLLLNGPWGDFKYRANVFGCLSEVKRRKFKLSTFMSLMSLASLPSGVTLFTQLWVCGVVVVRGGVGAAPRP